MDARVLSDRDKAAAAVTAGVLLLVLILPLPKHGARFCRECAVTVSGKGCMRSSRLRRGRARRRRRHGGSRLRERGPPEDDDGPLRSGNPVLGEDRGGSLRLAP